MNPDQPTAAEDAALTHFMDRQVKRFRDKLDVATTPEGTVDALAELDCGLMVHVIDADTGQAVPGIHYLSHDAKRNLYLGMDESTGLSGMAAEFVAIHTPQPGENRLREIVVRFRKADGGAV